MLAKLSLTHITEYIARVLDSQSDKRNQERCKYRLSDAGLAAFSVFYTQSPSFLSYQRSMVKRRGRSNAQSIFGLEDIPTDTHIRTLLDGINADSLGVIYQHMVTTLQREGMLQGFQVQHNDEAYWFTSTGNSRDNAYIRSLIRTRMRLSAHITISLTSISS